MPQTKPQPKNWQKIKLGEIAQDIRESYIPAKTEEKPYIGLEHIEQQTLQISDIGKSNETQSAKRVFKAGDILFGTLRPYFRKVARPKFDGVCSTDITVIRPTQKGDGNFLKYFIANQDFIDFASNISSGTRMPRANWKTLQKMEWLLPELNEQNKIGDILSAYDDLIENNTNRIKILEQIAQMIYREWFVYFRFPGHEKIKMVDSKTEFGKIPEGWDVKNLGDKIKILRGRNITKNTIVPGKVPVVAGGMGPAYFHNKANVEGPAITVSASGANSGYINLYHEDIWASDCSYINKNSTHFVYYYFLLLKNRQAEVTGLQRGSAQPHVYPKDLARLLIVDPPEELVHSFEEMAESTFGMINNFQLQNKNLRQVRDLLLPKLVTGELEIKQK